MMIGDRQVLQTQIGEHVIFDKADTWKTYKKISDTKTWGEVVFQRPAENKILLMGMFGSKTSQQIVLSPPDGYKFVKFTESGSRKTDGLTAGISDDVNTISTGVSYSYNTGLTISQDGNSLFVSDINNNEISATALRYFIGLQGPIEVEIEKE